MSPSPKVSAGTLVDQHLCSRWLRLGQSLTVGFILHPEGSIAAHTGAGSLFGIQRHLEVLWVLRDTAITRSCPVWQLPRPNSGLRFRNKAPILMPGGMASAFSLLRELQPHLTDDVGELDFVRGGVRAACPLPRKRLGHAVCGAGGLPRGRGQRGHCQAEVTSGRRGSAVCTDGRAFGLGAREEYPLAAPRGPRRARRLGLGGPLRPRERKMG